MTEPHAERDPDALSMRSVAHELRTPLTSVLGVLSLLDEGSVTIGEAEADELVTIGRREAEQMLFLVDNLLTRSRLATGALEPTSESIDVADVLREALAQFPELRTRTIVPLDRAVALADRRLVAQITANLFQNIDRYAPDGTVIVRFDEDGDRARVLIADEGPGIAAEDIDRVFAPQQSEYGLGVGMSISRDIARLLGGDLEVSREPLRSGATFVLTLPKGDPEEVDRSRVVTQRAARHTLPPGARLLVDMTEVLKDRSLDHLLAGINRMLSEMLDIGSGRMVARSRNGGVTWVGPSPGQPVPDSDGVAAVLDTSERRFIADLSVQEPAWADLLGTSAALMEPIAGPEGTAGVLVVGWDRDETPPDRVLEIIAAISTLAGLGVERARLAADVGFERGLRSSVIESLPIAISVFAGDPPRIIDWNKAEERLLGIESGEQRPANLAISQQRFDVRFLDGTRLDLENSPVATAIGTGAVAGPFYLRVTRADGTSVVTRTHCAPFHDASGRVAGAVVTSEEIEESEMEE